jgi:hypothetical protein
MVAGLIPAAHANALPALGWNELDSRHHVIFVGHPLNLRYVG